MKIAFLLLAPDGDVKRAFSTQKSSAVPVEIRQKYSASYKFLAHDNATNVDDFVMSAVRANTDHAVVLIAHIGRTLPSFYHLLPIQTYGDDEAANAANFLSRVTSFWTKRIGLLWKLFYDLKYQKALLLPFRNFFSSELTELFQILPARLSESSFDIGPTLEARIGALRRRQRPSARGRGQQKYFVDDRGYFFEYGHENHAQPSVEGDGHVLTCELNARVRFGMPYSSARHFNVTKEGAEIAKSDFWDCHGSGCAIDRTSHLNVFPNNYIE